MSDRGLTITAAVLATVGFTLLVVETIESLRSQTLSGLGTSLLFVGLGLFVVAAAMIVVELMTRTADPAGTTPADAEPVEAN